MVEVFAALAVGIGGAEDERAGVEAPVGCRGGAECGSEPAVGQVVEGGVAAEFGADAAPGFDLAEGPECNDLEDAVLRRAVFVVVADVADHVLADPVSGAEKNVTEFVGRQDPVVGPRPGLPGDAPFEHGLALAGVVPVQLVNT